jgi:hypothetical protein
MSLPQPELLVNASLRDSVRCKDLEYPIIYFQWLNPLPAL